MSQLKEAIKILLDLYAEEQRPKKYGAWCAWCNHEEWSGDRKTTNEQITAHTKNCSEHPIGKAVSAERERIVALLRKWHDQGDLEETIQRLERGES